MVLQGMLAFVDSTGSGHDQSKARAMQNEKSGWSANSRAALDHCEKLSTVSGKVPGVHRREADECQTYCVIFLSGQLGRMETKEC